MVKAVEFQGESCVLRLVFFFRYFCNGDLIVFVIYNSTAGEQIMSRTLVCNSIVMQRGRPFLAPLPSEEQLGLTSNFKMG